MLSLAGWQCIPVCTCKVGTNQAHPVCVPGRSRRRAHQVGLELHSGGTDRGRCRTRAVPRRVAACSAHLDIRIREHRRRRVARYSMTDSRAAVPAASCPRFSFHLLGWNT